MLVEPFFNSTMGYRNMLNMNNYANRGAPGSSPTACHQLQKEEVRPHQPVATEKEAEVIFSLRVAFEIGGGAETVSLLLSSWMYSRAKHEIRQWNKISTLSVK